MPLHGCHRKILEKSLKRSTNFEFAYDICKFEVIPISLYQVLLDP